MSSSSKQSILFINLKPPYNLSPSTVVLAAQRRTCTVHQALVLEAEIVIRDLVEDTERKSPCTNESFVELFDQCHTVVLPDSMFVMESQVFITKSFVENGLQALQSFYQRGGVVIVQCVEGALSTVSTPLNELFGTQWKMHVLADATLLEPTDLAKRLLGPFVPKDPKLDKTSFFVSCPADEGLYRVRVATREQFEKDFHAQDEIFERLGVEKDESMTCFNVEKSWNDYIDKYTDRYAVAIHGGPKGHVVWYGDRGQTDTSMAFIFCKMLNLTSLIEHSVDDEDVVHDASLPSMNYAILASVFIVILAIFLKVMGWTP